MVFPVSHWYRSPVKSLLYLFVAFGLVACVSERVFSTDPIVDARPYLSAAPDNYNGQTPLPLIITLHGSGGSGYDQGHISGLQDLVNPRQFILVAPDGEELAPGITGWYFSCCDPSLEGEDDVAYLRAVIADASNRYNVDPNRVYITGFSNGGFMAYQMACQASDLIAAVSIHAGTFKVGEDLECQPEEPVGIMHAHGTADEDVVITGGSLDYGQGDVPYISAQETLTLWQTQNECTDAATESTLDADASVEGDETTVHTFSTCSSDQDVVFWEMVGSVHEQNYTTNFASGMVDFLFSHEKS